MSEDSTQNTKSFGREMWDLIKVIVEALLIAAVIRTFIFGLVVIPSASMVPTLLIGDYLYVTKYAYGYSKHSFPFSAAPFSGRIFGTEPKLGDIVVFRGADKKTDYIKRLVGLPGDKIQMIEGTLHINGRSVPKVKIADFVETDKYGNKKTQQRNLETLPNGVKHNTLDYGSTRADNTNVFEIPSGHYFMMGDSRDNSNDSRFQDSVRMVAFEDIVGRADFVLLSLANGGSFMEFWNWPDNIRTDRMFTSLDKVIE
ncbi:MAG: signal peptidase I [Hyphomicrobiales bacterium]|nr:MAG: signal peptidase I [Hyphomicrobiales bacterium]